MTNQSMDCMLGIRTLGSRMEGADKSARLWALASYSEI